MELTTTSGYSVAEYTTEELAKRILAMPNIVHSFSTTLTDVIDGEYIDPYPWYCITCARLFDNYSVFINRATLIGGSPTMFDLPDYDCDIEGDLGEEQDEECVQCVIDGLNSFSWLHGVEPDKWYVRESRQDYIKILFNGNE